MFRTAIGIFVIALIAAIVAAIFGFTDIAAGAADIARIFFYVSLVIAVIAVIGGLVVHQREA